MDKGITLDQLRKVYHMACLTHIATGEKGENSEALDKFCDLINEIHETETKEL